ncbi:MULTISPECIES: histidinol-phosphatase [Hyphobacterium]|uniref:Histidinol-phosphatase n=1 Tax=Hyphobacterium vulgare TaxID=1736751 RepID=A0ABV6ZVD9_9PROT
MSAFSLSEDLEFAFRLADAAGEAILPFFRNGTAVDNKEAAAFDPVTEADRASEAAMRRLIEQHRPGDGILGEEFDTLPSRNGRGWTLDPIDGTRGFIAGTTAWTVLIAHTRDGLPRAGVIDQPHTGERFFGDGDRAGLSHRGATRTLRVSRTTRLDQALMATTDPYLFQGAEAERFAALRPQLRLVRYGMDAYAYALLAAGGVDLVVESGLKPFDVQALIPVVTGAGGLLTDWRGGPAHAGGQVVAAATPELHAAALDILAPAARRA